MRAKTFFFWSSQGSEGDGVMDRDYPFVNAFQGQAFCLLDILDILDPVLGTSADRHFPPVAVWKGRA